MQLNDELFFFVIENESSDDESSSPESPVPYLSRSKQNTFASPSIISPAGTSCLL